MNIDSGRSIEPSSPYEFVSQLAPDANAKGKPRSLVWLFCFAGVLTALIYGGVTWYSFQCDQYSVEQSRPLLEVIALFSITGVIYLGVCVAAIWQHRRIAAQSIDSTLSADPNDDAKASGAGNLRSALWVMFAWAVAFRVILLFSIPIQEVDLYRYIWDGVVTSQGISPYKYAPQEVQEQIPHLAVPLAQKRFAYRTKGADQKEIIKLAHLANREGFQKVFDLVHFEQYTTPYPPTNQPVFALAAILGSAFGSFYGYLYSMKGLLILFDLGTGLVLMALLSRLRLPAIWSVAWLWCPLVMKETSNSGHLDSIAVFLTTLAVYWLVVALAVPLGGETDGRTDEVSHRPSTKWVWLAFLTLALAVGAKVYPIVVLPIFLVFAMKKIGMQIVGPALGFGALVVVVLFPILIHTAPVKAIAKTFSADAKNAPERREPQAGIEAFARYWEMNDFLFMVLVENLKPYGNSPESFDPAAEGKISRIWFVKTSNTFRHGFAEAAAEFFKMRKGESSFMATRVITLAIMGLIVLWLMYRVFRSDDPRVFLEATFLTIAWFWLLAPTQNPWYWTWALPFICFCRNPAWYLIAVTTLLYYLRFYCKYHLTDPPVNFGTPYDGTSLFDFVVPVIEFAPVLILMFAFYIYRVSTQGRPDIASP